MYTLYAGEHTLRQWDRLEGIGPSSLDVQGAYRGQIGLYGGRSDLYDIRQVGHELSQESVFCWANRTGVQPAELPEVALTHSIQLARGRC